MELLTELNLHTQGRFFEGSQWVNPGSTEDLLPLIPPETLVPTFHEDQAALARMLAHRSDNRSPTAWARIEDEGDPEEGIEDDEPV